MLNERICKLRDMLNDSILTGKNYSEIYNLSVKLDELIAEYYTDENNEANKIAKKDKKTKIKIV